LSDGRPRVLVTGSSGLLGSAVVEELRGRSVDVVPYDVRSGDDVLDLDRLTDRAAGCSVVAHLAAVPTDLPGAERTIGTVNVLGVWNVVLAAEAAGVGRIVFSSSVNAIGVFMGQGPPLRFPIDDNHPARPATPYSVAKLAAEEILAGAARRRDITTLCLRFPALMHAPRYRELLSSWRNGVMHEIAPYWEYGAYLDVRDAALAVAEACCRHHLPVHARVLLADDRPAHVAPLAELVELVVPVALRDQAMRSLETLGVLVDTRRGWELLGVGPLHHWLDAGADR
jgi:UDP-glucose 4-epimerase